MNASELQQLIAQGEGQQLEFKRSLAELETAARTVVAFANTDGGLLLFGVRDSGDIPGVEVGQNTKERITSLVTETSDPVIYPSVELIKVGERTVIAVRVAASENRPHLCKGRAYKRVGGETDLRLLGLNERQIEALRMMTNEGRELTNSTYRQLFEVSRNTASRDLQGLLQTGWVKTIGEGKGRRYRAG